MHIKVLKVNQRMKGFAGFKNHLLLHLVKKAQRVTIFVPIDLETHVSNLFAIHYNTLNRLVLELLTNLVFVASDPD